MPASNATVSKLYGNRCGFSGGLNQEALSRDCSMLIDINRVANGGLSGLSRLSSLFCFSRVKQRNKPDRPDEPGKPNEQDRPYGAI